MLRTLESHKKNPAIVLQSRPHVTVRATNIKSTADWIHVQPKENCDGTPIWGTQDAIFNRISLRLKLKKRDFQTSRIQ